MAGLFVLLSLALGVSTSPLFHNVNWLWFTVFASLASLSARPCAAPVGANLFQSGITGWCLMDMILAKLGVPAAEKGCASC